MKNPWPAKNTRRARRTGRGLAESLLQQGRAAFHIEEEEDALEIFPEVLRIEPDNLRCHYLTALCAHLLTREELLEQTCYHALELAPRHPYTVACEAVRYLYLSNFARSEALFEQALRALPKDIDLYLGLGILHEYAGNKEKGVEACTQALHLEPQNVRAHVSLGAFYAMDGEFDAAMVEYREAKALAPELESPHQRLGRDYYYEGMVEQAASEFARATDDDPAEPAAWFFLLDCLRRLGRTDDSLDIYEDIRQRFGTNPGVTSGFFEQFNMRGEAVAALEKLSMERPDSPDILFRLSSAYREVGRLDQAIAVTEKLHRLVPDDPDAAALLGELHFKREQYQLAASYSRRAVKLNRNAQNAYITLADALLFLGRQGESCDAIREMERARSEAWESYQARFSGQDRADAGL